MKVGSLFSGGGLGDFGFMAAGMEIAWQCEIDEYCQKILELRYPESKKYRDIKTLKGADLEPVDILTGGFPCQPFSVAGKRKGKDDNRYLWPEMLRIIKECRPRWVIGENVVGITNLALDTVCADLEAEGYEVWPVVFPSHALGAWHKRDRIWIICNSEHTRFNVTKITGSTKKGSGDFKKGQEQASELEGSDLQYAPMADTNEQGSQGRKCGELQECSSKQPSRESSTQNISDTSSQRCESRSNNTGENGKETGRPKSDISSIGERWSSWWQSEPAVGRVATRDSDELDATIRRLGYENWNIEDAIKQVDKFRWEILREMWHNRESSTASLRFKARDYQHLMSEVPQGRTYERWNMGSWIEGSKTLCDLWERIYTKPLEETENLQCDLLVGIRERERKQKVAKDRVNRLKALGNAQVPACTYVIGKMIMDLTANVVETNRKEIKYGKV